MNIALLLSLDGSTQSCPLSSHDADYYVDDGRIYKPVNKRYDSMMPGYWVTFVEQGTTW